MRTRLVLLVATAASIVVGGIVLVTNALAGPGESDRPTIAWQTPGTTTAPGGPLSAGQPPPLQSPFGLLDVTAEVAVPVDGMLTWAALDRTTGELVRHGDETSTTESMIKPWIAADYLRRLEEAGERPSERKLAAASAAIRDSDDEAAEQLYVLGGHDEVVERLIELCDLTDTTIHPFWWSRTEMTAVDAVRMGECLADGRAAGPNWTEWVLTEMRQVRGTLAEEDQRSEDGLAGGRWGIIDGLPDGVDLGEVAIKNGWTRIGTTDSWHVNCLAITPEWTVSVLMRYPAEFDLAYGAQRCATVATQLIAPAVPR